MSDELSMAGRQFTPYDLVAPTQLLVPGPPHNCAVRSIDVPLGRDDHITITFTMFGKCSSACRGRGSHGPAHSVRLRVPDPHPSPHCDTCDCSDYDSYVITDEQVARLREALDAVR